MANIKNFQKNLAAQARDPQSRFIIIVGSAVAITGLVVAYLSLNETVEVQTGAAISAAPTVSSIPGGEVTSPFYERVLDQFNREGAQRALERGGAFVPTIQGTIEVDSDLTLPLPPAPVPRITASDILNTEVPDVPRSAAQLPPQAPPIPVVEAPPPPPEPAPPAPIQLLRVQVDDALAQSMSRQIGGLLGAIQPGGQESTVFFAPANPVTNPEGPGSTGFGQTNAANASLAPPAGQAFTPDGLTQNQSTPERLVPAGEILFGRLVTRAVTTQPGPVLAEVVGGPLGGSRLIGEFSRRRTTIVMEFETIVYPDGRSAGIDALAVDPADGTTGLATSVNSFFFERFVVASAAAFIGEFTSAIADTGGTTTASTGLLGTTTTETSEEQSTEEAFFSGVSAAADVVTEDLEDRADFFAVPEVTVAQGTLLGILFLEELVDQPPNRP